MGSVYSGWDTNLGRAVVIKVPHVRFVSEAGFRARFAREIGELVRLEHPHIVRILAQGLHDEVPFFVLQYLGGGSLEDVLEAAEGAMPIDDAMVWFPKIAATLDFVHGRGTVHRDVKPGNILFDDEGHVFLSDFGVAKALGDDDSNLTDLGTGVGSPRYMAPEQITGGDLTPAADQYALASALYEAVAGHPPFRGDTTIDVLLKKRSGLPMALSERLGGGFPAGASDAVQRALATDPSGRFASCRAFAEAVQEAVAPQPEPAEAPVARSGPGLWIAVAIALVVAIGLVSLTSREHEPEGGATNDAGPIRLTLLEAGAEPRKPLRYEVKAGPIGELEIRTEQKISVTLISSVGRSEPFNAGDIRQVWTLDMTVDEVRPNGEIALSWFTKALEFAVPPGGGGALSPSLIEQYTGFHGTVRFAPNGMALASETMGKEEAPPMVLRDLERMDWTMRNLVPVFPKEPVGVGARWEVTESTGMIGMRLTHTTTYHLVALEGGVAKLEMAVAQTAAKQRFSPYGNDVTAMLLSLHATGESTSEADLANLIAREDTFDMVMNMEMDNRRSQDDDKPSPMKSAAKVEIHIATRRK